MAGPLLWTKRSFCTESTLPPSVGDPDRSESQEAREAFVALSVDERAAVLEFLESLVLFAFEEED